MGELHAAVQIEERLVGSSARATSTLVEAPPPEEDEVEGGEGDGDGDDGLYEKFVN